MKDIQKLLKLFDQFAYTQQPAIAFTEILDYFLIAFKRYETVELVNNARETLTNHPNKEKLVAIITEIGELSEGFHDPLGEMYMQVVSKGRHGQYFTPEHLCDVMAKISIGENSLIYQSVSDPACGSGRMLLAAAKMNRHLRFYGADIDLLCCKMALVNMLLNSLTGEIAHMNTLSNEFHRGYKISTIIKDGFHYPDYKEFTDPNESYIWRRPASVAKPKGSFTSPFEPSSSIPVKGVQGNLFDLP